MSSAMSHFSPFSNDTWEVLAFLSLGLNGNAAITITASKRGMTLKVGRWLTAHGKTPRDLCADYKVKEAALRRKMARMKAKLDEIEKQ